MKILSTLLIAACGLSATKAAPANPDHYVAPMKKVAAAFKGNAGVVLHIGDSITYANPYGQWARFGEEEWNGTLLRKGDVHPSAGRNGVKASSAPTEKNFRESGYLLRGWLTVQKIAEVKGKVIDQE